MDIPKASCAIKVDTKSESSVSLSMQAELPTDEPDKSSPRPRGSKDLSRLSPCLCSRRFPTDEPPDNDNLETKGEHGADTADVTHAGIICDVCTAALYYR